MAAGSIQSNVFGLFASTSAEPFGRDTLSTDEYDRPAKKRGWPTSVERLGALLRKHADPNPALVEAVRSPHEKLVDAMVVRASAPSPGSRPREIVHVHITDHSSHVVLSPQDCKLVIDRGWGERHSLSGISVPKEYLMVYAPRDDGELEAVERIIVAGSGCMTNSFSVN